MITKKRDSLEKFIREQLVGPGGCNYRYSVLHSEEEELDAGLSWGEVLSTTPGSIYSSAILFPQKEIEDTLSAQKSVEVTPIEDEEEVDETDENANEEEISEERNFDHTEDIDSLGRRFPNKFGLSCCLAESKANDGLCIKIDIM